MRMLERLGHHARVVSDGRAALARARHRRVRRRADGRADAGDGRSRGHAVDPGAGERDRRRDRARARGQRLRRSRPGARPHPHRRPDRSRDEERRGALSHRRHGRLSLEARHGRGTRPGPGALRARARRAGCCATGRPRGGAFGASTATSSSSASCARSSSRNGPPGRKSCDRRCTPWTPRAWSAPPTASRACSARSAPGRRRVSRPRSRISREDGHLDAAPAELVQLEGAVAEVIAFLPCPPGRDEALRLALGRPDGGVRAIPARSLLICSRPGGLMALAQPRVPMIEQDILGGCAWSRRVAPG